MYVIFYFGVIVVKVVVFNLKIFFFGGILIIGILGNIFFVKNFGIFFGLIDEIRIWFRLYNLIIVVNNWKLLVLFDIFDIFMVWFLNDGYGLVVLELKGL